MDAVFDEADLSGVNLEGANLKSASFIQANLAKVNFDTADLSHADLTEANLRDANLYAANLTNVDLRGANLTKTLFGFTTLVNADLSNTIGLETITHKGPSPIDINTIRNFKGKAPTSFLRGCGLTDLEIEYAKLAASDLDAEQVTLITYEIDRLYNSQPIQFNSCFISYSSTNENFAVQLYSDLQKEGVRCWFAPEDIKGGKKIHEQIEKAIQIHDRLLLVLSEESMSSEWVKTEIAYARKKEIKENRRVLFPISIVEFQRIKEWKNFDADTGKDSAREIREYFIPNFNNWQDETSYKQAFERLLRDLKE